MTNISENPLVQVLVARARAEGHIAGLREAVTIAENQDRTGREWVAESLWANIVRRVPDAIRARLRDRGA